MPERDNLTILRCAQLWAFLKCPPPPKKKVIVLKQRVSSTNQWAAVLYVQLDTVCSVPAWRQPDGLLAVWHRCVAALVARKKSSASESPSVFITLLQVVTESMRFHIQFRSELNVHCFCTATNQLFLLFADCFQPFKSSATLLLMLFYREEPIGNAVCRQSSVGRKGPASPHTTPTTSILIMSIISSCG